MPKPLAVQIMEQFRADLLVKERQQTATMVRNWQTVERSIIADVEAFTEQIAQDNLTPAELRDAQFQVSRFGALLAQTRTQLDRFMNATEPQIARRTSTLAAQGANLAVATIRAVAPRITFDILPVDAIRNIVALSNTGSPLRSLLDASYGAGARGMFDQLISGVALGRNPNVIARNMVRDGLSQTLSRVINVARTEPLRAFRESSRQQYINSGVVEGYRRLAAKSDRTCPACLIADGEIYEVLEEFREHPQGRCTTIPNVTGFAPVQWETGKDWLIKQPPAVQQKILGPGRFNAFQNGMDLDEMVSTRTDPTWGDSLQPTPVRDLGRGRRVFQMRQTA